MVIVDLWYSFRLVSGEIAGFACEKMKSLKVDGRVAEEWSAGYFGWPMQQVRSVKRSS